MSHYGPGDRLSSSTSFNKPGEDEGRTRAVKKRKRKLPKIQKSLAILIASLQGHEVVIELKDDSEVRGMIELTDELMNVSLMQATHTLPNGTASCHESFEIKGRLIRYVHINPKVKVHATVANYMRKLSFLANRGRAKLGGESKRPGEGLDDVIELPSKFDGEEY